MAPPSRSRPRRPTPPRQASTPSPSSARPRAPAPGRTSRSTRRRPTPARFDTTGLADGLYDLRVFTTDAAGNAEAAPATIQVRIDNTLPTGAVTAPAAGANVRGTSRAHQQLRRRRLGRRRPSQFQRSPAGAGTWTNQGRQLRHHHRRRRPLRPPRRHDRQRRQRLHLRRDHRPRRQHAPDRRRHRPGRRRERPRHDRAHQQLRRQPARGVATVQFQRSPAGAGTWTNQAASFEHHPAADGQYDLRVATTDNAGNAFTSAAITIRVDNTAPDRLGHRPRERRRDRRAAGRR